MRLLILLLFIASYDVWAGELPLRDRVLSEADKILNLANVSYVYGGKSIGQVAECDSCTACLRIQQPPKDKRLETCPICEKCSLDCSHFISLVFQNAGLSAPYLTTRQMLSFSKQQLKRLSWVDLGDRVSRILEGDLLVYAGHVVLVERVYKPGVGQVVHSTSGREITGPGQGIQRQTLVQFGSYKGRLLRVLRHSQLQSELISVKASRSGLRSKL